MIFRGQQGAPSRFREKPAPQERAAPPRQKMRPVFHRPAFRCIRHPGKNARSAETERKVFRSGHPCAKPQPSASGGEAPTHSPRACTGRKIGKRPMNPHFSFGVPSDRIPPLIIVYNKTGFAIPRRKRGLPEAGAPSGNQEKNPRSVRKVCLGPDFARDLPLRRDPASVPEDLSPGFRRNGNQTALNSFGPARQKPRFPKERGQNGFLFLCFQVPFSAKQFSFCMHFY